MKQPKLNGRVLSDQDDAFKIFEICLYEDNKEAGEELFRKSRRSLPALDEGVFGPEKEERA